MQTIYAEKLRWQLFISNFKNDMLLIKLYLNNLIAILNCSSDCFMIRLSNFAIITRVRYLVTYVLILFKHFC